MLSGLVLSLTELHENEIARDSLTGDLCNILITSARKTLGSNSGKNQKEKQFSSKPWFDLDCKFARKNYRKIKRRFKSRKTDLLHSELRDAEKKYKVDFLVYLKVRSV
jgi:hypothetical protein